MTALFEKRFAELEQQLIRLQNATTMRGDPRKEGQTEYLAPESMLNWSVKVKALLERVCGKESSYLQRFTEADQNQMFDIGIARFERMRAVFLAAKEDFEGGYLNSVRNLVQAEVFGSELEQASELLAAQYVPAAAVIAGVVLETSLRNLCTEHGITHGSLNRMNDELVKAGAYNSLQHKRITAMAAIRNSAAHGKKGEFEPEDVKGMLDDVERFLASTLQ
ncbi:DUF4145 domain-containing protein [Pseudomonas kribbensis]|uniref:DUF4145 domain-containing protein n=1 Tax=Pseudomonas kribbensis TaxID=1628086 RepID=A0A345RUG5_9PSED|nr:DUF4145 domain-containing protein [Pseudomonas kribbensis]AXI62931.1 DUF4145 domain-containing protein [Pseudomonas kribbensis]